MKTVTAGIFRAPMALNRKNTKTSQKATRAMPLDGLAPGSTFSTYRLASESCRCRSSPSFWRALRTTAWTILATTKPTISRTRKPIRFGRKAKKPSVAFWKLFPRFMTVRSGRGRW